MRSTGIGSSRTGFDILPSQSKGVRHAKNSFEHEELFYIRPTLFFTPYGILFVRETFEVLEFPFFASLLRRSLPVNLKELFQVTCLLSAVPPLFLEIMGPRDLRRPGSLFLPEIRSLFSDACACLSTEQNVPLRSRLDRRRPSASRVCTFFTGPTWRQKQASDAVIAAPNTAFLHEVSSHFVGAEQVSGQLLLTASCTLCVRPFSIQPSALPNALSTSGCREPTQRLASSLSPTAPVTSDVPPCSLPRVGIVSHIWPGARLRYLVIVAPKVVRVKLAACTAHSRPGGG